VGYAKSFLTSAFKGRVSEVKSKLKEKTLYLSSRGRLGGGEASEAGVGAEEDRGGKAGGRYYNNVELKLLTLEAVTELLKENGLKKFVPIVEVEEMDGAVLVEITSLEGLLEFSEELKPVARAKTIVSLIDTWKKEGCKR